MTAGMCHSSMRSCMHCCGPRDGRAATHRFVERKGDWKSRRGVAGPGESERIM
eukprot:CAMPEP_0185561086 /NCGR_PEP_ID=MMETSP1381-20130426/58406_1 /TAXON_ID=298111 /ORGANISM="Pavlova sp., Strain CCMP459" /LENGTH=52 /DNA_ID=CAMNT_0028174841 /DNA_START=219 /DNA_END=374 /DNA_ORIENTATION=+